MICALPIVRSEIVTLTELTRLISTLAFVFVRLHGTLGGLGFGMEMARLEAFLRKEAMTNDVVCLFLCERVGKGRKFYTGGCRIEIET